MPFKYCLFSGGQVSIKKGTVTGVFSCFFGPADFEKSSQSGNHFPKGSG